MGTEEARVGPARQSLFAQQPTLVFLYAGLVFLLAAIALLTFGGLSIHYLMEKWPLIQAQSWDMGREQEMSEVARYTLAGRLLSYYLGPLLVFAAAAGCAFIGVGLLRSAGAVSTRVIPPQDYELLSKAIQDGNEKAVSEYIRLSSLSGTTGTFTKIGLTGLPLAMIFLTVLLALLGMTAPKLLDLAQLTLGAFIGSYVQKKQADLPAS